jgi:hypothetical protein
MQIETTDRKLLKKPRTLKGNAPRIVAPQANKGLWKSTTLRFRIG